MTILKAILDAIIAVLRFIVEAILAILRAILWLLKKFSSTFSVKASAASLIFSLTARGCLQFSERAPSGNLPCRLYVGFSGMCASSLFPPRKKFR
ncbi:hypothetical protein [Cardiobacterium hominis]